MKIFWNCFWVILIMVFIFVAEGKFASAGEEEQDFRFQTEPDEGENEGTGIKDFEGWNREMKVFGEASFFDGFFDYSLYEDSMLFSSKSVKSKKPARKKKKPIENEIESSPYCLGLWVLFYYRTASPVSYGVDIGPQFGYYWTLDDAVKVFVDGALALTFSADKGLFKDLGLSLTATSGIHSKWGDLFGVLRFEFIPNAGIMFGVGFRLFPAFSESERINGRLSASILSL